MSKEGQVDGWGSGPDVKLQVTRRLKMLERSINPLPQQAHDAGGRRSKPPESACVKAGSHFARGTARKPRCTDLEEGGASLRSQRVCKGCLAGAKLDSKINPRRRAYRVVAKMRSRIANQANKVIVRGVAPHLGRRL